MMFGKFIAGTVCGLLILSTISCSSKDDGDQVADVNFKHSISAEEATGGMHSPHGDSGTDPHSGMSPHGAGGVHAPHGAIESGSPDDIVATVNGEKIFRREVTKKLDAFKQFVQPEMLPRLQDQIVSELITQALLKSYVAKQNIEVKQEDIDKGLQVVKDNLKKNPTTADMSIEEILESQGETLERFTETLKIQIALDQLVLKDLDEAKMKEHFEANKESYSKDTVTASHILVDTRNLKSEDELSEAKKKIDDLKKKITEGADFAELAKEHSDCPSGAEGGDLGPFPRTGAMVEPFAEAAFKLNVDEVSDPVKTQFGYHLIKVTEKNVGNPITFEESKERVKSELKRKKTQELIESLWADAEIEKG